MTDKEKFLELKVGAFVLLGLLTIAYMAYRFGKMGDGARATYPLTVQLPNADGVLLNSDVMMAGAKVGSVSTTPRIGELPTSVLLEVQIHESIKVPRATNFTVGSSGLLGDRFIEISPNAKFDPKTYDPNDPAQFYKPGERVVGGQSGGLNALMSKGEIVMEKLIEEIDTLKITTTNINENLLSAQNLKNLEETFANLKTSSASFAEVAKNANLTVLEAGKVVSGAQATVESAKKTMETADGAAGDLRKAIGDARKVLTGAQELVRQASEGKGLIGSLLNDPKLANDLRALVSNMRQRGVLFYRDTAAREEAAASRRGRQPARE